MHGFRHHFNDPERRQWQDPEAILKEIGLKPGLTIVDAGCGGGFFILPAARLTGPSGKVLGLDINAAGIEEVRRQADLEGLTNLELKVGAAEENILCRGCADIVFLGIVLHDFQDPGQVLRNAYLMLKPGGLLANLDWRKITMKLGPPLAKRFDEETASRLINQAGFKIESVRNSGLYHYLILARPDKTLLDNPA